jgi:hypothetical protein
MLQATMRTGLAVDDLAPTTFDLNDDGPNEAPLEGSVEDLERLPYGSTTLGAA